MDAAEALEAYRRASDKAWRTFCDYQFLRASEHAVHIANREQADALVACERAIADLQSNVSERVR